jgi:hypothetical protein
MTFGRETCEENSHQILNRFAEAGGNFVDTTAQLPSAHKLISASARGIGHGLTGTPPAVPRSATRRMSWLAERDREGTALAQRALHRNLPAK